MPDSPVAVPLAQLRDWHRASEYHRVIEAFPEQPPEDPSRQLLLGLSLAMSGDADSARPLLSSAISTTPTDHDGRSDHALANIVLGDIEKAAYALEQLVADAGASAVDFSRLGAARLAQQREEEAAELYREAIEREPDRQHWHYNLAGVLVRLRRLEEALEAYEAALRLAPDFEQATNARRELLLALERSGELVLELESALASDPENHRLRIQLCRSLVRDDRFTDGMKALADGLIGFDALRRQREQDKVAFEAVLPAQTGLRLAMAELWSQRGRHARSLEILRRTDSLQNEPDLAIRCQLVQTLVELQRLDEAASLAEKLREDFPDNPRVRILAAQIDGERGEHASAESELREMLARYPGNPALLCSLGQSLMWTGKLDEAAECFRRASTLNPMALAQMVRTRRLPDTEDAIQRMRDVADNVLLPREARSAMSFALAEACDRRGDPEQAAHYLQAANASTARDLNYQSAKFDAIIEKNIAAYSSAWFAGLPAIRPAERQTIFVVGMPRSGTTLVEQILSAHPEVFGAGELDLAPSLTRLMPRVLNTETPYPDCLSQMTPALREEAARYYLHGLDQHDSEHTAIVDKLPHNFVHLGLIASILPAARIIHLRRDPRDVGLSNFQQNFKARHGGMGFAFDLEHIAGQLNAHHRIMAHWRKVLPIPILDVHYEALVVDQASVTREMLEFLGLAWRDEVLQFEAVERTVRTASVSQVREPIYTSSSGKWVRFEKMLQPMIAALEQDTLAGWD